jgi:hypothetical protein
MNLLSSSRVKLPNGSSSIPDYFSRCSSHLPWADLQSALLHHFTSSYATARAYWAPALHGTRRLPGTTWQEAVQLVAELVLALSLKGVPLTAWPNEQLAYIYQNQL